MACLGGPVWPLAPSLALPGARADLQLGQSWFGVGGALPLERAADWTREPVWDCSPARGGASQVHLRDGADLACSWCRGYRSSAALPREQPPRPASAPGRALAWLRLRVWSWDWLCTPPANVTVPSRRGRGPDAGAVPGAGGGLERGSRTPVRGWG